MNINVYLEDSLANQLREWVDTSGKSRNTIIREAVSEWLAHHQPTQWPRSIINFKGCPDMPPFESTRTELLPAKEDPFA